MEQVMLAEKIIRKHVAIIHAYSLMSALQRKIVNVLLYEATNEHHRVNHLDSVAVESRVAFSTISKAVNFKSNNTQYLKEAIDGLASIKIEWNLLKDKAPTDVSFLNLRILHGSPTFYQDGTFNFSFHKIMLDLVQNPSIYGTVDLELQAQFESKYGHSLYENSTRFVNLQKNKIIQLDTFRKLLGVDENKYPTMRELIRNVIKPAVEEVNDRANFVVGLDGIKIGRKIIGYELSVISKKKSGTPFHFVDQDEHERIHKEIQQTFGTLNESVLESIFKNYSDEYIVEKIIYTKKFAKKERTGFYPIPYFISALRDDYKSKDQDHDAEECSRLPPLVSQDKQWHEHARLLQADISHWKRILAYQKEDSKPESTSNIQKIINQCEDKLEQHHLNRPELRKEVG